MVKAEAERASVLEVVVLVVLGALVGLVWGVALEQAMGWEPHWQRTKSREPLHLELPLPYTDPARAPLCRPRCYHI